ncbi:MAG: hypothetical protein M1835_001581 [Candelina submexicana]|nr:MAG: hypothetical protein M1835_001581 [Candelina submexicana]
MALLVSDERLSSPEFLGLIIPFLLYLVYTTLAWPYVVPKALPWIGWRSEIFSAPGARLRAMLDVNATLEEGYRKYSKQAKSFILPLWPMEPSVIVPQTSIKWLIRQRDEVVSFKAAILDRTQSHWTFMSDHIMAHDTHREVIVRYLNQKLASLIPATSHELAACFEEFWGVDTQKWNDILVFDDMMKMVARASNRVFNKEVCRNETFFYHDVSVAQYIAIYAFLIRAAPPLIRSAFAQLLRIPLTYHHYRCSQYLQPIVKQRLADIGRKQQDETFVYEEPNEFLSWIVSDAYARNDPLDLDPTMITYRMLVMNFAAIYPSSITITNVLLNLFSSAPEKGFVEGIREEATRILADGNGMFTKAGLDKMVRTDSAIRESMRLSSLTSKGLDRTIVAKEGLTMEDGVFLPQGTKVGTALYSIHRDESFYTNANKYDAFRFSRPLEEAKQDLSVIEAAPALGDMPQNAPLTQTSDTFLEFGHGRHACPGRFFASVQLKLLIASLVLNYDVKPLATRPENTWIADYGFPPRKATLQVRRRKTQGNF